jgi:heme exporter protein A
VLEGAELECERGGRTLFSGLSFTLRAGEALRIAGANGSGKTSLLRILCGLLPPDAGEVRWQGERIRSLREEYARQLVYLGHAPAVKDELTAEENLQIASRLSGMAVPAERIKAALGRFQVPGSFVKRLSQGQKRRAALARLCLAESVPLWLLDEPFTALDAQGIGLLKELIETHTRRGGMVAFTTHQDPGIAASRVLELG